MPTDNETQLIIGRLESMETAVNKRIDDLDGKVTGRLDQQDRTLGKIETQTTRTNGRVTKLEQARARAQGVKAAFSFPLTLLATLLSGGLTTLILALAGALH